MESNFTIGRIAGIRIGVNWTWLVVFALITWSLATVVFPDRNPGLRSGGYWAMAAVAALLFFLSILLHELGHGLQARREGVEIEEITLWLFGGVAKLGNLYRSSGAELRIAVAGPIVTAVIAVVLILVGSFLPLPDAVDGVIAWLGYINVLVLVFNLIPALPLDGGRILHAILWGAKHDLTWATRVGAAIGRAFGYFLIAVGILAVVVTGSVIGGLWLAFIGWFLSSAAGAEARSVIAHEQLSGVRVRDVMVRDPVTVDPRQTIGEFLRDVVTRQRHSAYPVVDRSRVVGLLLLQRAAEVPREEWDARSVGDRQVPLAEVPTVAPDAALADVVDELGDDGPRHALVLEAGRLVGLLSASDIEVAAKTGGGTAGGGGTASASLRTREREKTHR